MCFSEASFCDLVESFPLFPNELLFFFLKGARAVLFEIEEEIAI